MSNIENLREIRKSMKKHNIDHYLIPSADAHQSEYVPDYYRGRAYVSGFTGSAGTLLVSENCAKLWADGRYFIQAAKQIEGSGIDLMKIATPGYDTIHEYLKKNVRSGETLGFYGRCYSANDYKTFKKIAEENNFKINMDLDLLEETWSDRPKLPKDNIYILETKYAGKSASEKLKEVRAKMVDKNAESYLITSLDDIAWLFNIRGNDVLYTPVVLSFAIITKDCAKLYIDKDKVSKEIEKSLNNEGITVLDYDMIESDTEKLTGRVLIDPAKVNASLYCRLNKENVVEERNITTDLKAVKNDIELKNFENCQIKDGVAMVKFIKWLKENVGSQKVTEMSATKKLTELRAEGDLAKGDSFATIAAYKDHAAMMHYSATENTDVELKKEGLFLVDSGGQYLDGTTDITRTIVLGKLTEEEKRDFTLVLRSHIDLAKVKFLKGATGANLDAICRLPMWENGLDYKCGTGHGVGFLLSVHEGPQNFSQRLINVPLELNMNLTNEPGIYKEGKHGIRTENMVVVTKFMETDCGTFYQLKTVTYCPIDLDGVDKTMLSGEELAWLNDYHKMVYEMLSPYLDEAEKEFLKHETRTI